MSCPNATTTKEPPAIVAANIAVTLAYTLYLITTLAAWRALRPTSPTLQKRSFLLVSVSALGGYITVLEGPVRLAIGPDTTPCAVLLWLPALVITITVTPMVLYLERFYFMHAFGARLARMDARTLLQAFQAADDEGRRRRTILTRRAAPTVEADERSATSSSHADAADRVSRLKARAGDLFAGTVIAGACVPVLAAAGAMQAAIPRYALPCVGCELDATELAVFFTEGFALFLVGAWFLYQIRDLQDHYGIVRDLGLALLTGGLVGFPGFVLIVARPGDVPISVWYWFLNAGCACFHTCLCTANVWRALRGSEAHEPTHLSLEAFRTRLRDPRFHAAFSAHCVQEFSVENIMFVDCVEYFAGKHKNRAQIAHGLRALFFEPDAPLSINISARQRDDVLAAFEGLGGAAPREGVFDAARDEIVALMHRDTLPRFERDHPEAIAALTP